MYAGYCLVRKFVNEFTKAIAKPCDELTQGIREVRQGAREVKVFFEDKQNREELIQVAATAAALGACVFILKCFVEIFESKPKRSRVSHRRASREIVS